MEKDKTKYVVLVLVGLLLVFSVVQSFQIDDLEDSGIKTVSESVNVQASTSSSQQVVAQKTAYPSMVGGC
jgi:hypothetical protein